MILASLITVPRPFASQRDPGWRSSFLQTVVASTAPEVPLATIEYALITDNTKEKVMATGWAQSGYSKNKNYLRTN